MARENNFIQRKRKFDAGNALWSMINDFAAGQVHSVAGLHRSYNTQLNEGNRMSWQGWHKKLNCPEFSEFCFRLYQHGIGKLYRERSRLLRPLLNIFDDVLLQDGTSHTVQAALAEKFPGRFTKTAPAAIELHTLYSLKHGQYEQVALAPDSQSEHDFMPRPKDGDVANKLHLFDAGYWNPKKLNSIQRRGGYFIVRAHDNFNPKVVDINPGSTKLSSYSYKNQKLQDVRYSLKKKKDYDFKVEFKSQSGVRRRGRCLLIWNPKTKKHVIFFTCVPVNMLNCQQIGAVYRLRWQVELSYKELKSYSALKKFQSKSEHIIEGLIWLSLLADQVRRFLVFAAEEVLKVRRFSTQKAASSAKDYFGKLVQCVLNNFRNIRKILIDIFDYFKDNIKFSNPHKPDAFQKCNSFFITELTANQGA